MEHAKTQNYNKSRPMIQGRTAQLGYKPIIALLAVFLVIATAQWFDVNVRFTPDEDCW
jgi:hypothetical protein